jgi:hypothetical protein
MTDLLWDEVSYLFDPEGMGALPDFRVPGARVESWQSLFDLVGESGWRYRYLVEGEDLPMPRAEAVLSRPGGAPGYGELHVWPAPDVLAIFRPCEATVVDFDMDLRELQGQEKLDLLCGFLRAIGRRLGLSVFMDPEGDPVEPVLGFDVEADRFVVLAEPPPA